MRRRDSPLERLARECAAGVTDDGTILGETSQNAPARVPDRRVRGDTRQLLNRRVPGNDPQLLVDNEERITRPIVLRLLHAHRCVYGSGSTPDSVPTVTAASNTQTEGPYRANASGATFNHYGSCFNVGLNAQQKGDFVEYLKSR